MAKSLISLCQEFEVEDSIIDSQRHTKKLEIRAIQRAQKNLKLEFLKLKKYQKNSLKTKGHYRLKFYKKKNDMKFF